MLGMQLPLARVVHGGATPLVVIIGLIAIIIGAVMVFQRRILLGAVLIIVGILLGGLSVF
jgi:hypothetical protein